MIGIVTVNWNGYQVTRALTSQILACADPGNGYRLVVVNNSPGERALFEQEITFRDPRVEVIHAPSNLGYSGGLNLGLKALLADPQVSHFLLLNNDVALNPDFLVQMQAGGGDPQRIYAPLILYEDTGLVQNTGGNLHVLLGGGINLNKNAPLARVQKVKPGYLSGCILFLHRRVVESVGLFDEAFGSYCEDVDYCYRSRREGIGLEILWDVHARHFHSYSTLGNRDYKVYLLNRNQILLAKKHLPPPQRWIFISAAILRGAIQNFFNGQFRAYLRGVAEGLSA